MLLLPLPISFAMLRLTLALWARRSTFGQRCLDVQMLSSKEGVRYASITTKGTHFMRDTIGFSFAMGNAFKCDPLYCWGTPIPRNCSRGMGTYRTIDFAEAFPKHFFVVGLEEDSTPTNFAKRHSGCGKKLWELQFHWLRNVFCFRKPSATYLASSATWSRPGWWTAFVSITNYIETTPYTVSW